MKSWHALEALALSTLLAAACGDDSTSDDEVGDTSEGESSGDGDGDGESSSGDGDGDGDGDTESTSESSSESDSDSSESSTQDSSESDTTDTTDTGPIDESTYSALAFPGGLDRVIVTRVNEMEPSCTQMVLVAPQMFDMFDIAIDDPWRVEQVRSWDQLECDTMVEPDAYAEGGVGTVEFLGLDAFDLYPCALAFEIEFDMDTDPPSTMDFISEFVMVEGVNCG